MRGYLSPLFMNDTCFSKIKKKKYPTHNSFHLKVADLHFGELSSFSLIHSFFFYNIMSNPKAIQTFLDLEIARCNERYNDIPELTKRYKKYHPYESGTLLFT